MSTHENLFDRPWSNQGSYSSHSTTCRSSTHEATINPGRSKLKSQGDSITSMSSNQSSPKSPSSLRKPSFKIELPPKDPLMSIHTTYKVISNKRTNAELPNQRTAIIKDCSLPTLHAPEHLTPPEESQLEGLDLQSSVGLSECNLNPFPIRTVTMMSNETGDEHFEDMIDDMGRCQGNESSKLDFGSIATFAVNELAKMGLPTTAISMVHQPLPFPLPQRMLNNDPSLMTLFIELTSALQNDPRLPITGIRIFHTLIDKLPQENLPTSPPITPSHIHRTSTQQARGYFTIKPLYPAISGPRGLAVPPGEALISITERIIPSSGEFEISSLLSTSSDSDLQTRLAELHPGGLYILILPTLSGGQTFHKEYLSKLLDPILRNMIIRHGLRNQLAPEISHALTLHQLLPYEAMKQKLDSLLTARNADLPPPSTATDLMHNPEFTLLHAQRGTRALPFEAWYSWWLGQERARILGVLNYHLNTNTNTHNHNHNHSHTHSNSHDQAHTQAHTHGQPETTSSGSGLSKSSIMLELDAQMRLAGAERGQVGVGIEVGCFVVQRARRDL